MTEELCSFWCMQASRQPCRLFMHAGGVLADALVSKQTSASIRTVFGPKVTSIFCTTIEQIKNFRTSLSLFCMENLFISIIKREKARISECSPNCWCKWKETFPFKRLASRHATTLFKSLYLTVRCPETYIVTVGFDWYRYALRDIKPYLRVAYAF